MNKEEKEAIDDLKLAIEQDKEELPYSKESLKNKQAILNYINKLQKENEELKEQVGLEKVGNINLQTVLEELQKENGELKRKIYRAYINDKGELKFVFDNCISKDELQKDNISKDIIRAKIKELTGEIHRTKKGRIILKDIKRLAKIEILKELLGG